MLKLQQLRALTKTTEALEKREAGGALQNLFLLPLCALRSGVASELFDFEKTNRLSKIKRTAASFRARHKTCHAIDIRIAYRYSDWLKPRRAFPRDRRTSLSA